MGYIETYYPNKVFIVEVKYSGDITITEARCREFPKERDNKFGFTTNYSTFAQAEHDARVFAKELNIKCGFNI